MNKAQSDLDLVHEAVKRLTEAHDAGVMAGWDWVNLGEALTLQAAAIKEIEIYLTKAAS